MGRFRLHSQMKRPFAAFEIVGIEFIEDNDGGRKL